MGHSSEGQRSSGKLAEVFKDNLLQSYKQFLLILRTTSRSIRRLAWLSRELMTALHCKMTVIQEVKSGIVFKEGI